MELHGEYCLRLKPFVFFLPELKLITGISRLYSWLPKLGHLRSSVQTPMRMRGAAAMARRLGFGAAVIGDLEGSAIGGAGSAIATNTNCVDNFGRSPYRGARIGQG